MSAPQHFGFHARVLLCQQCGAPLSVAVEGGSTPCTYCGAVVQLTRRVALPAFAPPVAAQPAEPTRLRNLAAQLQAVPTPPSSLTHLFAEGEIAAWRAQESFAMWQSLRGRALHGDLGPAEDLLFLTLALARQLGGKNESLRQRALLESTLEALQLPRHRQLVLGALCRGAASEGNLADAERWLQLCDPRSEDLPADTAYRVGRGLVATMRGQHTETLAVLGEPSAAAPITRELQATAALLRANAVAFSQGIHAAAGVLRQAGLDADATAREASRYPALALHPELLPAVAHAVQGEQATARSGRVRSALWSIAISVVGGAVAGLIIAWRAPFIRSVGSKGLNFDGAVVQLCALLVLVAVGMTIRGVVLALTSSRRSG